jgi:hypothetical protein
MNITGHNSYHGCRFCKIEGTYSQKYKHVYFPPKSNYTNINHSDWIEYVNIIESAITNKEKEILLKKYGKYLILLLNYY